MCVAHGPNGINGAYPGRFEYGAFSEDLDLAQTRKMEEVVAMSPEDMARSSRLIMGVHNELLQTASSLEDRAYRELMTECIVRPKVTFLDLYKTKEDRRRLFDEMMKL